MEDIGCVGNGAATDDNRHRIVHSQSPDISLNLRKMAINSHKPQSTSFFNQYFKSSSDMVNVYHAFLIEPPKLCQQTANRFTVSYQYIGQLPEYALLRIHQRSTLCFLFVLFNLLGRGGGMIVRRPGQRRLFEVLHLGVILLGETGRKNRFPFVIQNHSIVIIVYIFCSQV